MLNVITSLSLDVLANDMLDKINQHWQDPFYSPIVVFPDAKSEQWFKLHMLQNGGISMNLHTSRLESFLFDVLKTNPNQSILSPDLLRDIIIQKLLPEQNGTCYLDKIRDQDNIGNYLYSDDNTINYKHLFDFASDLARLFIEYEATRPNINDAVPNDDWQNKLYQDIMNDGIVFNDIHYYTCPELAEQNKSVNNGKIVFNALENPHVFVFGFSGMGQTFRNLLSEFSKTSNLYVYLQTTSNGPENENVFLKHWAQFGNTNCMLFDTTPQSLNTNDVYKNNTTLGKIQNAIANDKNIENLEELKVITDPDGNKIHDKSLTITSAPSKIKELEIVHSGICKLLQDPEKNVKLQDILVLAPDIDQYKSAIATVFDQIDETLQDKYPHIPISIVDYNGKNSSGLDLLQTLYSVLQNGGLTRRTFFDFTKNFIIQNKYQITDGDVTSVFQQWIEGMRVYRIHNNNSDTLGADDWQNAVNRLLVAKLTDKTINFADGQMEPFSDFNSEDNKLVKTFVQIFDDINNKWINKFNRGKINLDQNGIQDLQEFLKYLFDNNDAPDAKLFQETFVYTRINRKLDRYMDMYQKYHKPIPMDCVMSSLLDIVSNTKFNSGTVFTRGVTFTSLLPNRILPAKYVFLIGFSSDVFPGVNQEMVMDRRSRYPQNGDDDIPGKNKTAFLCQLMAARDELHISFVNKDLQTDNDFYPSYMLDVLEQYTGINTKNIGLDENRDWSELYTPRERRNKQLCIDLKQNKSISGINITGKSQNKELPDIIHLTDLRYFLENPLKSYAKRVFGYEENDKSSQELEDTEINYLDKHNLECRLIKPLLEYKTNLNNNCDDKCCPEQLQWLYYKDLLPNEPFGEIEFKKVYAELAAYVDVFLSYKLPGKKIKIEANFPINVPILYHDDTHNKEYVVRGEILMCAYDDADIILYVRADVPLKKPKKTEQQLQQRIPKEVQKRYYEMYALVAQIAKQSECPDKEYTVHMVYVSDGMAVEIPYVPDQDPENSEPQGIKMTGAMAEQKLNEFYNRMFIQCNKEYLPYFDDDLGAIMSLQDLQDNFNNRYKYNSVSHKDLLKMDADLGFSKDNFVSEFKNAIEKHAQLLDPEFNEE